jgi:hypothetical protein
MTAITFGAIWSVREKQNSLEPSKTLLSIEALRLKLGHFGAWPLNEEVF